MGRWWNCHICGHFRAHPVSAWQRTTGMVSVILIGVLGGLITGISPCIVPVLPVIFLSGSAGVRRPLLVVAGLVLSFSISTLLGSMLLQLFSLPANVIRGTGLIMLALIGLGLIFPAVESVLERPFARIPQPAVSTSRGGFGLGLVLGLVFVPCAGPVLAAIVVAGATGSIGPSAIALTIAFGIGVGVPLAVFALAGQQITNRVSAFRRRQRGIRVAGGVTMIVLSVALALDLPATLQRAIPDYTTALQHRGGADQIEQKLNLGGIITDENRRLSNCHNGSHQLEDCGPAPGLTGIDRWLNSSPLVLAALRGKVVLIDFWAYSCINCQRSIPHVIAWSNRYRDDGLVVVGVHTPEYAFEKIPANVADGARKLGITYPIAMDNNFSTWTNYRNRYWPARYLIDAHGHVRQITFGEGGYDVTENLIRQLLIDADAAVNLPSPTDLVDATPTSGQTPETFLSVGKVVNYAGPGRYDQGEASFSYPQAQPDDTFALSGRWLVDYQGATARSETSAIRLRYHAKSVYIVAGGKGSLTVDHDGALTTVPVDGPPNTYRLAAADGPEPGQLEVRPSQGLQVYSFAYG